VNGRKAVKEEVKAISIVPFSLPTVLAAGMGIFALVSIAVLAALALVLLASWALSRRAGPALPTKGRTLNFAAPVYDLAQVLTSFGMERGLRRIWADLIGVEPTDRILDLGCGTGALTAELAGRLTQGTIVGLDAAPAMIAVAARKRASGRCCFRTGCVEALPFESGEFDIVVSSMTFHHLPLEVKRQALAESLRVLRPGGRLVVIDLDRPVNWLGRIIGIAGWLLLMQPPIRENIRGVVAELIEEAGFEGLERGHWRWGIISVCTARKPADEEAPGPTAQVAGSNT
jgi:SAM-dependent methyltransferase